MVMSLQGAWERGSYKVKVVPSDEKPIKVKVWIKTTNLELELKVGKITFNGFLESDLNAFYEQRVKVTIIPENKCRVILSLEQTPLPEALLRPIFKFTYLRAFGCTHNRKIKFFTKDEKFFAIFYALRNNIWTEISKLDENAITVSLESESDKLQAIMERENLIPVKILSELTSQQIMDILSHMTPHGNWQFSITEGIGRTKFEIINRMHLFYDS